MSTEANQPAYPLNPDQDNKQRFGLNKREYFAAMAMQGIMAGRQGGVNEREVAEVSVSCADELIKQLNK